MSEIIIMILNNWQKGFYNSGDLDVEALINKYLSDERN